MRAAGALGAGKAAAEWVNDFTTEHFGATSMDTLHPFNVRSLRVATYSLKIFVKWKFAYGSSMRIGMEIAKSRTRT